MPGKLGLRMPEGDARAMYVCTAGRKLGLRMPEGDARAMYVCMYVWLGSYGGSYSATYVWKRMLGLRMPGGEASTHACLHDFYFKCGK